MKSTHVFASLLAGAPLIIAQSKPAAQCMSSEEEAEMLQKLMHD